ncbi:MAG: phage portal protein [Bacteroidales bacterium]|nr:phage portal protein [Bacteroidales bacterium]
MGLFSTNDGTIMDWLDQVVSDAKLSDEAKARIQQAAVRETAIRTAVSLIADLISGCEIRVYEDGKQVKNDLWYTFNVSANMNEPAAHMIAKWIVRMYYEGESILVPLSNKLFCADSFNRDEYPLKGDMYSGIVISTLESRRTFRADKVYVLRQYDPRIRLLLDEVCAVYLELMEYSKKAYAQNSGEKYAIQLGARASGETEEHKKYLEQVKKSLATFVSAESAALPLNKDQTIQRLSAAGTGQSSSDYPALRKEIYSVVSEILHLPAGLLEGNITSVDQIINETFTFAIDPLVHTINEELTRKSYKREDILNRDCHVQIDTTSIKHIDVMDMANNIDKLISSGFMSIDEVRAICDAAEINEDWSNRHYITKNYEDIEKGGEQE